MILNLDINLFFVGLSAIGMGIMGLVIYLSNYRSFTHQAFFLSSIFAILWGIFNYLYNQPFGNLSFLFLKIHLVFAIWYTFWISSFLYYFPNDKIKINIGYLILILYLIILSILSLTNFIFEKIVKFDDQNRILEVKTNMGIIFFGATIIILLILGFFNFIKNFINKEYKSKEDIIILIGIGITFLLHILFNLIFPNLLNNPRYTQFSAVYTFPFIFFSGFSILKYKFLNTKIIITDIFVLLVLVLVAFQTLSGGSLFERIIRLLIFLGVLILSLFLIRGVRKEIEQAEQLRKLNEELDKANRVKSEFLSFASHQLKSPMAVIKGYASLMMDGTISNVPDQIKDFASKIKKSIDDLLILIEEFMDYRKIDENRMEFNFEEVEIVDFIKNIFDNYILLAKEKGLEFGFENRLDRGFVNIDKIRFAQVIQNLIDNALKYTKSGFVKICLEERDNNIVFYVKDSGIGMSKELQTKLFGQFIRDPSIRKEIQGTGLGLYIAKYIVEAHKGKIWAESEGENKGSQFYVEIPKLSK